MSITKLSIALVTLATLSACGTNMDRVPDTFTMGGRLQERAFDLDEFSEIYIDVTAKISIRQSTTQSLIINTEADHFGHLVVLVDGDRLMINHDGRHDPKRHIGIIIEVPSLDAITLESVVDARIYDIDAEDFVLDFDGIGDLSISGRCEYAQYDISGIGDFDASDFYCADVKADLSGIGSFDIYASETLRLDVSGIGDVTVSGNPRMLRSSIDGIGSTDIGD
jgi:Putative auto-transporter adhesin, head GIN domain